MTQDPLPAHIPGTVDLVTLFFVLSAIAPEKMVDVLRNLFEVSLEDNTSSKTTKVGKNRHCYIFIDVHLLDEVIICMARLKGGGYGQPLAHINGSGLCVSCNYIFTV